MATRSALGVVIFGLTVSISSAPAQAEEEALPVSEHEVSFRDGDVRLAGTLYAPRGRSAPAMLLIGGSERGPRTPYKRRMARLFAGLGVTTLTYDSPGTGGSTGNAMMQTREDRAREVLAGVRLLREQPDVVYHQVGVWGLSEGAGIALLAKSLSRIGSSHVSFAIAVSGAFGLSPFELTRYRIETQGHEQGLDPEQIDRAVLFSEIFYGLLAGAEVVEWSLVELKARRWPDEPWPRLVDIVRKCGAVRDATPPAEKEELLAALKGEVRGWRTRPWFPVAVTDVTRFERFLAVDAASFFTYLARGPFRGGDWYHSWREYRHYRDNDWILAVWGDEDTFVPPHRSAAALRDCWGGGLLSHKCSEMRIIPGANHVMTVGDPMAEFAPDYPGVVIRWLDHWGIDRARPR